MRIVSWNIRAGGGSRVAGIAQQLERWTADIVCLCEFRGTAASLSLAAALVDLGYVHQQTTAAAAPLAANGLLVASRRPLEVLTLHRAPLEPKRWLSVRVGGLQPFVLALMHAPNMVTGRKLDYLEAVELLAHGWRRGPAVFLGDTNCGWPGIDEERPVFGAVTQRWLDSMVARGWVDAFRHLSKLERFYTWYSPNGGNGFRLDQAFVNRRMLPRLRRAWYEWGMPGATESRTALSDHAALLLDFHELDPQSPEIIARAPAPSTDPF